MIRFLYVLTKCALVDKIVYCCENATPPAAASLAPQRIQLCSILLKEDGLQGDRKVAILMS